MLKLQNANANAKLAVFFLLVLFSAQTQSKTYLKVRNCTDSVLDVKLFNGNDTVYMAAASKTEELGIGESTELYCNHKECDLGLRERKNFHDWKNYDANTNLDIRVEKTSFSYSTWDYDFMCHQVPHQHKTYVWGDFDGDGKEDDASRERGSNVWMFYRNGDVWPLGDKLGDIFDGRREDQVYRVGDFDNDGKDEIAWMQAGFEKWVVNDLDEPAVELLSLGMRNIGTSLDSGKHMVRADFIKSSNGKFRFRFQSGQNLVIEKKVKVLGVKIWKPVWNTNTGDSGAIKLHLETSGNLKLIGDSTKWQSGSKGSSPRLVMEDSGRLAIYSNGNIIWSVNN